jgi:hypothetical protein
MRGSDERSGALFSYVDLEARVVPISHPLRTIRVIVNGALAALSPGFHDPYARVGRPLIPPEQLLRALLLQAFYSIRSERQLMDRLDFDLRWFVGLGIDDPVWNHLTFSKNCDRLLAGDVAAEFLARVFWISRRSAACSQLRRRNPAQEEEAARRAVRGDVERPVVAAHAAESVERAARAAHGSLIAGSSASWRSSSRRPASI